MTIFDCHWAGLADAVGTIAGLVFHGGVPPRVEVEHVVASGEVEVEAARLEGSDID